MSLRFGFGKRGNGDKKPEFVPTEGEIELVQRFLDDRGIGLMDAKKEILGFESVPEGRREQLGEWVRDFRASNPQPMTSGPERGN